MQKKKSFDIMLKKNKNQYNHYRKDFFMNIISQNFKNANYKCYRLKKVTD